MKNYPSTKIVQKKLSSEKEANERKANIKMLARDIEANGIAYVRSKQTVDELLTMNDNFKSEYDSEDGMFTVTHSYTGRRLKSL